MAKRTRSDKVLREKTFEIAGKSKIWWLSKRTSLDGMQFFGKKSKIKQNQQLANELHKSVVRKFKRRRVCFSFTGNISGGVGGGVDLADMQLISKYNKGIRYVLCAIDVFSKYVWVVPIKDKKGVIIVNAFQKILDSSERKSNKIWVDKVVNFTTILLKNG